MTPVQHAPQDPAYMVQYTSHNTPTVAVPGSTIQVDFTLRNESNRTWVAAGENPIHLGYHWYTLAGEVAPHHLWDDHRTALPHDLAPGDSVSLQAKLSIPNAAGVYQLRWDIVEEMVAWFTWKGQPTLDVTITVQSEIMPSPQSDVVVEDIAFERNELGRVRLAALVKNIGGQITGDVVGVAFLVDGQYATFGVIDPLPGGEAKAVRAVSYLDLDGELQITAIADDVNRFEESQEHNNSLSKLIDFSNEPARLADVVIDKILPEDRNFSPNQMVNFSAVVKNIGDGPTGDIVGVAFLLNDAYLTFGVTDVLAAGASATVTAVASWQAVEGRHQLTAVADDINRFPEADETNNRASVTLTVETTPDPGDPAPDVVVESLGYSWDAAGKIILQGTVANLGSAITPTNVAVSFFLQEQYVTFGSGNPLEPGQRAVIAAAEAFPWRGQFEVTAVVDEVDRFEELNEQNNTFSRSLIFTDPTGDPPPAPEPEAAERRILWISRYDWTAVGETPTTKTIDAMLANIQQAGFTDIYFQVRGAGDAFYTPGLEPWSARLTGTAWQTLGQDPGWDPLAYLLEKGRAAGLRIHAYLNMYTVWMPPLNQNYGQIAPPATNPPHFFDRFTYGAAHQAHPGEYGLGYQWRQHHESGTAMPLSWGQYIWASPGVDAVQNFLRDVTLDVVRRYTPDGIHLDYLRYYGTHYSFDPPSNAAAGSRSTPQRTQWQRDRVTALLRDIYNGSKQIHPSVEISAAAWPIYQRLDESWPYSEGYHDFYQDSIGWLQQGIVDILSPMLYNGAGDDFEIWQMLMLDFVSKQGDGLVMPGIGADTPDFSAIAQRINAAREADAAGVAIFSYDSLNRHDHWEALGAL